jgi:hypothetical protein
MSLNLDQRTHYSALDGTHSKNQALVSGCGNLAFGTFGVHAASECVNGDF